MTDWQNTVNLMKVESKKRKVKKNKTKDKDIQVGLRCWECGQYIDNLRAGHYCTNCLIKHLKKFGILSSNEKDNGSNANGKNLEEKLSK